MEPFKSEFDLPVLTDEIAAKIRHILYTFIDLFEAHYCHKIDRYQQHLLSQTEVLNLNRDHDPF